MLLDSSAYVEVATWVAEAETWSLGPHGHAIPVFCIGRDLPPAST